MAADSQPDDELRRIHEASPLVALSSHGFGPLAGWITGRHLDAPGDLIDDPTVRRVCLESLGATAHAVLRLLDFHDGRLGADAWAFESAGADPDDLAATMDRLGTLGLARVDSSGGVSGITLGPEWFGTLWFSYDDPQAVTSDELAEIVRWWGIDPPNRKAERSATLRGLFADGDPEVLLDRLKPGSRILFGRLAEAAGSAPIDIEDIGIESHELYMLSRRGYQTFRYAASSPAGQALAELSASGLIGFSPFDRTIWIWQEAWVLARRPLIRRWPCVPAPSLVARRPQPPRVGEIVTVLDRALLYWDEHPPKVLKNNAPRFAKPDVRAAARELGVGDAIIEVAARLLIQNELFLPNVVAASGRGRNRKIDSVWRADPDVVTAWSALSLLDQWLFLVQRWLESGAEPQRESAARQLVLYELLALPPELAWAEAKGAAAWLEHRYAPLTDAAEFATILEDLGALGVVDDEVVALTTLGRQALVDPAAARDVELGGNDTFIVQPDFSIVAPPDLAPEIAGELAVYATLESSAGAHVYRLDDSLIIRAIQRGTTPEAITDFLDERASVPLPDVVIRFIDDAARRADRFALHAAATVLITNDPVDLADAVSVKSAKLVKVGDTVAISALAPEKVRAALAKRRIEARVLGAVADRPAAQRSADRAEAVAARAAHLAEHAERSGHEYFRAHAEQLKRQAEHLRNPSARFALVDQPLVFDPALLGHHPPDNPDRH